MTAPSHVGRSRTRLIRWAFVASLAGVIAYVCVGPWASRSGFLRSARATDLSFLGTYSGVVLLRRGTTDEWLLSGIGSSSSDIAIMRGPVSDTSIGSLGVFVLPSTPGVTPQQSTEEVWFRSPHPIVKLDGSNSALGSDQHGMPYEVVWRGGSLTVGGRTLSMGGRYLLSYALAGAGEDARIAVLTAASQSTSRALLPGGGGRIVNGPYQLEVFRVSDLRPERCVRIQCDDVESTSRIGWYEGWTLIAFDDSARWVCVIPRELWFAPER